MVVFFRQSITFKDNKYYIQLPWESEKLSCIPSNHSVAICILDHVAQKLECDGLYQDYLEVFHQQKHDGIIGDFYSPSPV